MIGNIKHWNFRTIISTGILSLGISTSTTFKSASAFSPYHNSSSSALKLLLLSHYNFSSPNRGQHLFYPNRYSLHNNSWKGLSSRKMVSTNAVHATKSDVIVVQLPCLDDNYGYIIHDPATGDTGVVDTPDAKRYEEELKRRGWTLTHILNTHHHWDHTGGNLELKQSNANVHVYGPALEKEKIPGIDTALSGNDDMKFGSTQATILQVSGHTNGHIAYYFPKEGIVFTGDALFALGCGRMFEGTPPMFWSSLKTLRELPDDTIVYCAHEYTLSNAKFAMSVEPNNQLLASRNEEIKIKRANTEFTVPSQLGLEKKTNPFLRIDVSDEIRRNVGAVETDTDEAIFAKVRKAKDNFRG